MSQLDHKFIQSINERYTHRLDLHGESPKTLGWSSVNQQQTRFKRFYKYLPLGTHSITDIGCGFGDFASFLSSSNNHTLTSYTGIDINPNLLEIASLRQFQFSTQFLCGDILHKDFFESLKSVKHDVIISAGIFNLNFYEDADKMHDFLFSMLDVMLKLQPSRIMFDFIPSERTDSYPKEDFIAVYDIPRLISYLNLRNHKYILDLNQLPNPMTEALLVVDP